MTGNSPPTGGPGPPPGHVPVHPPHGDGQVDASSTISYSDRLMMNVKRTERLKRKVLEITLEVDNQVQVRVERSDAAKVATRIGLDPLRDLEGYQICPGNSKKILLWLKESCNIERYCKDEVYRVAPGIRTGFIRPMDRRQVVVTVKGLNFNTPDSLVVEYLNKHGKVTNQKVIYDVDREGPFKGIRNGDRKYQCDFTQGINLGSYHIIDGHKVFIFYVGQKKTCGRCFKTSGECLGGGIARQCDEKKGQKVKLVDHMAEHWREIGFQPSDFKLEVEDSESNEDVPIHTNLSFTPVTTRVEPSKEDINLYTGVVVKNIPEALPEKDIRELFVNAGVDEGDLEIKLVTHNGKVTAEVINLESETCCKLIESLNETKVGENKIYCRGFSDLSSPPKTNPEAEVEQKNENDQEEKEIEEPIDEENIPGKVDDKDVHTPKHIQITPKLIMPGLPETVLSLNQQKKLLRKQNKLEKHGTARALDDFDFSDDEVSAKHGSKRQFSPKTDEKGRRIKNKL